MSAAGTSPTPYEQLRAHLTQLMDVDTSISAEEKTQLISNLCFVVNANKHLSFDPQAVHLVLGTESISYAIYFVDGSNTSAGRKSIEREGGLAKLREVVEQIVADMCKGV